MAANRLNKKWLLATHNQGKVKEFQELLQPFDIEFVSAADLVIPDIEETAEDFAGNALLKARHAAQYCDIPVLADDSGFCVAALGGAPGVYSARWSLHNGQRDFAYAMAQIYEKMQKSTSQDKTAWFVCVLALILPTGQEEVFEGRVYGEFCWPPRGEKNFGYDPVFIPQGYQQSFAEMDRSTKQRISHRAVAFEKLVKTCFPPK